MKKLLSKFCVLALATALLTTAASAVENPFSDIASDSELAQSVMWAYESGVTSGTTTTTFSPDATCTRGQVVTFLWRSQGEPTPTSNDNPFTDVASDAYYYSAVLWAVEEGITSGTSATEFSPDSTCTTAQVLTFLYRANGEPDATGEGAYYDDAVNWATSNSLATSVDPDSQSPRSDIVTYLWKNAGSPEMEVTDPEPMEAIGTYMGTIEEYQSTFDTMFDKDGYRVVTVGEKTTSGTVGTKYGVIDQYGTFIVEPVYDSIVWRYTPAEGIVPGNDVLPDVFHAGYVQVTQDGKYGLVNSQGVEVIPCVYDFVSMPSEGMCTLYNVATGVYGSAYSHYVGYWNLSQGREILAPDTYFCTLMNAAVSGDGATNPEGYFYCYGDFIGGYAMVITDNSYEEDPNSYPETASPTVHIDYANLIDTNGNFVLDESVLVYWLHSVSFTYYPQKGQYLQFWEATDYSDYWVTNEYGTVVDLECSVVYETGLTSANGVVLEAQFSGASYYDMYHMKYRKRCVLGTINLDQGYFALHADTAPNTLSDGEDLYFNLSGQSISAVSPPAAETTYTIVVSDGYNAVQRSDGTMTVDYGIYTRITYGVDGSTWCVCQGTNGLWGLVDITTGEEILPCMYDAVGLRSRNGEENINHFEMGVCYVKLGDKEYLVDANNTIQADVTGLSLYEAVNGLYKSSSYSSGFYDNQGREVLPGYTAPEPWSTYTLYQLDGKVYQVSANYLK